MLAQDSNPEEAILRFALDNLQNMKEQLHDSQLHVGPLEGIAVIRFGLYVTATWMYRMHLAKDNLANRMLVHRLTDAAKNICDQIKHKWPR